MSRLRYVVHGRGRGHATRALAIVERLEAAGHEVLLAGGEDALPVLGADRDVERAPSLTPDMGPVSTAVGIAQRVWTDRRAIERDRIALVISDGDLPSVLAASLTRRPSIAVGHGLVFSHGRPPQGVSMARWNREARKARAASWTSTRQVAVNFVPIEAARSSAVIARPEIREGLERDAAGDAIVTYFRDDNGQRVLETIVAAGHRPVLFSDVPCGVEGVDVRPREPAAFASALRGARAVVSSAGSQLISECAHLGVPQFALFDAGDDEQALNVEMLAHTGLGAGASFASHETAALTAFLDSLGRQERPRLQWKAPSAGQAVVAAVERLLA